MAAAFRSNPLGFERPSMRGYCRSTGASGTAAIAFSRRKIAVLRTARMRHEETLAGRPEPDVHHTPGVRPVPTLPRRLTSPSSRLRHQTPSPLATSVSEVSAKSGEDHLEAHPIAWAQHGLQQRGCVRVRHELAACQGRPGCEPRIARDLGRVPPGRGSIHTGRASPVPKAGPSRPAPPQTPMGPRRITDPGAIVRPGGSPCRARG